MQVILRRNSADFDGFADFDGVLSFLESFDVGDGVELRTSEASSSNSLWNCAWLDDLDKNFEDTSPPANLAQLAVNQKSTQGHSDVHGDEKSTDKAKLLIVPHESPFTANTKRSLGQPRSSRKEELEYLRMKVKEMENELQRLKKTSDGDRSSPPLRAPTTPDQECLIQNKHSIAVWKSIAERQKNQRDVVEVENTKLRDKLKTQVRMAKSLKRILSKRTRDGDQMLNSSLKRTRTLSDDVESFVTVFGEMLQRLDELYVETDEHIAKCPAATVANAVIRKKGVKYSDAAGMFLEFQDSKLLPLDVHAVNRATWRFLTETGRKCNKYIEEHVEMRGNTMLRKFGVEIKHDSRVAVLYGREVVRRYTENDRVVLVRHSIIDEIHLPDAETVNLSLRESGWIVLRTAFESVGTTATRTQAYSTLSPVDQKAQWKVGTLTEFLLQSREDVEVGNDTIIENLLLEELSKESAKS